MKGLLLCFLLFVASELAYSNPSECPKIIRRTQWAGSPPGSLNYLIVPIPYVIIQHTVTPECTTRAKCSEQVESIRSYHMDNLGWNDIGYSFLIGGDGNIYEGCGWNREGAHTYEYNKKSIGIAFIGNFQDKEASSTMVGAAHKLVECGKIQGALRPDVKVLGAKQVQSTVSPGAELYTQIQEWSEWAAQP